MAIRPQSGFSAEDTPLLEIVFQRIQKSQEGSISFSDYMDLVLYDPEHGYYAAPESRTVGRKGDFFTSVSVGELFGFLLAEQIRKEWKTRLNPHIPLVIVEQGAHDGQLARDILTALAETPEIDPTLLTYRIVDPRAGTRGFLRARFAESPIPVEVVPALADARAEQGVFLCNELLDAFAFDRVIFRKGVWRELRVGIDKGHLSWMETDLSPALAPFCRSLPDAPPEGYSTEICRGLNRWAGEVASLFETGLWWIIDYGFEAEEYFAPGRTTGTFRCYRDHRADEDPFSAPGETDITSHVNFTHLRIAAELAGLSFLDFTDQHHFLIHAAKDWLLSLESSQGKAASAQKLRQFQTLTHPGMMGQQFKVAVFGRSPG